MSRLPSTKAKEVYWNELFQELVRFNEIHGHTLVPTKYADGHPDLPFWVRRQYMLLKRNENDSFDNLDENVRWKIEKLKSIGFHNHSFRLNISGWDAMYELLIDYRNKHGSISIPKSACVSKTPDGMKIKELKRWLRVQRKMYYELEDMTVIVNNNGASYSGDSCSSGVDSEKVRDIERTKKLLAIEEFIGKADCMAFKSNFDQLKEFKAKRGNLDSLEAEDKPLHSWLQLMIWTFTLYLDGAIPQNTYLCKRLKALEDFGIKMKASDGSSSAYLKRLKAQNARRALKSRYTNDSARR